MKKIVSILAVVFILAACNNDSTTTTTKDSTSVTTDPRPGTDPANGYNSNTNTNVINTDTADRRADSINK
jgi:hypothetical protein